MVVTVSWLMMAWFAASLAAGIGWCAGYEAGMHSAEHLRQDADGPQPHRIDAA